MRVNALVSRTINTKTHTQKGHWLVNIVLDTEYINFLWCLFLTLKCYLDYFLWCQGPSFGKGQSSHYGTKKFLLSGLTDWS